MASKWSLRVAIVTAFVTSSAAIGEQVQVDSARYDFSNRSFTSVFENTLIFGHTVSGNFLRGIMARAEGPGDVLAKYYAGREPIGNISEPHKISFEEYAIRESASDPLNDLIARLKDDPTLCDRYSNLSETESQGNRTAELCFQLKNEFFISWRKIRNLINTRVGLESGLYKMERMLYQIAEDPSEGPNRSLRRMNKLYERSSVLIGIDAFFIDATTGDYCGGTESIAPFVDKVYNDGKVLILGNVPLEDRSTFSYLMQLFMLPQNESCRQTINHRLKQYCVPEKNCYLVDLEAIVHELVVTRHYTLKDGTKVYLDVSGTNKGKSRARVSPQLVVRPDGVHLSARGVQLVVEDILSMMEANPPRVNQVNLKRD